MKESHQNGFNDTKKKSEKHFKPTFNIDNT